MKEIYLFGVIGEDILPENVARQIEGETDVTAYINSSGGYVDAGFALFSILSEVPNLTTVNAGRVYSAAMFPFLAGKTRIAESASKFLIHSAAVTPDRLTAYDAVEYAEMLLEVDSLILDFLTTAVKVDPNRIANMMKKDSFLTAKMAQELGIVTKIANPKIYNFFNMANINDTLASIRKKLGLKSAPKNMLIGLEGGGSVYVYTEDEILEGKTVVLADENGEPTDTPAPDGEHTLADGRVITVQDGVIVSTAEASAEAAPSTENGYDEKMKEMEDRLTALSAQNAALAERLKAAENRQKAVEELAEVVEDIAAKIQSTYVPDTRQKVLNRQATKAAVNGSKPEERPRVLIRAKK